MSKDKPKPKGTKNADSSSDKKGHKKGDRK